MSEQSVEPGERHERLYSPIVESIARAMELEDRIQELENTLFGGDPALRTIETALFIDPIFHKAAVIMDAPKYPERMFGHEAWAGWLSARVFAREHAKEPLTVDFLKELNQQYMHRIDPADAGKFRETTAFGGVFVAGTLRPVVCTDEQIVTINNNPLLEFDTPAPEDPHYGFIHYKSPPDQLEDLLSELCDDYNQSLKIAKERSFVTAARIQRQFSTIHPFRGWNGGESRVLMNLILENAGHRPCVPRDFDEDITMSLDSWTGRVAAGITSVMHGRAAKGITDPAEILGIEQEKRLYQSGFPIFARATPHIKQYGAGHNRFQYETFLSTFEVTQFLSVLRPYSVWPHTPA